MDFRFFRFLSLVLAIVFTFLSTVHAQVEDNVNREDGRLCVLGALQLSLFEAFRGNSIPSDWALFERQTESLIRNCRIFLESRENPRLSGSVFMSELTGCERQRELLSSLNPGHAAVGQAYTLCRYRAGLNYGYNLTIRPMETAVDPGK